MLDRHTFFAVFPLSSSSLSSSEDELVSLSSSEDELVSLSLLEEWSTTASRPTVVMAGLSALLMVLLDLAL